MKIWAVLNVTHLEVVRVFGTEEAADEYATYENMKSDEDHFINKGFEVDERTDVLYDFTIEDLSYLEHTVPAMYLAGEAYTKCDSMRAGFRRKVICAMASQNATVYCITKTINHCSSIDFYRSEHVADREYSKFKRSHPINKHRIFDEEHPEATIQLRGYFVEE